MTRTLLQHRWVPAVNFGDRRDGKTVDMLLLHYTGMESAEVACNWLTCAQSEVSCHYLVDEAGEIVQMVEEDKRAWHAGRSFWKGEHDINSCSIGIEIHNAGHNGVYADFPVEQMDAVVALSKDIIARYGIAAERVLGHSDVAPGRKRDPGEKFDWQHLHGEGIGHWVEPVATTGGGFLQMGDEGDAVAALQTMLAAYGYNVEADGTFDTRTASVVAAFQRHFRQATVDGVADRATIDTMKALIDALPSSPIG